MLRNFIFLTVVFIILIFSTSIFASDSDISILQCESNAIANRDYYFNKNEWVGKDDKPSDEFRTGNKAKPNDLIMRSKIFANLNTNKPIIKSITPPTKYMNEQQTAEFEGTILNRTDTLVTITWKNPNDNKIWFGTINLKHKKAIVTYNKADALIIIILPPRRLLICQKMFQHGLYGFQ